MTASTPPRPAAAAPGADTRHAQRARRQHLAAWLALCLVVGLGGALYLGVGLGVSDDPLLMPLDDTYIHFQYARQLAEGEPMRYSTGDPPTSGGTSLLYPALLAIGYRLGFTEWSLAYWAVGLGMLCHLGAAWMVYRIARVSPFAARAPGHGVALAVATGFALTGPILWGALSGMETAPFVFAVLLAFYAVLRRRLGPAIALLALLALLRPEGLFLGATGALALALWGPWPAGRGARTRRAALLALPVLAGAIQPAINWLATGSVSSSGMQAKSILYDTGAPLADRLARIGETFGRMWLELLTGHSADFGWFTSPALAVSALAALLAGTWLTLRRRRVNGVVLMLVWLLALTAGVATLDTAFWQFKRYQIPAMALFYPAAGWCAGVLAGWRPDRRWLGGLIAAFVAVPALWTALTFARNYGENVRVVRDQQVPMARWAAANLPAESRVAVHDVGLMGYFSGLPLYDVVGLTTDGPAASWRQGPGAIYEHMASAEVRPDYFAIYPDVQGLRYLQDAGVFGETLATFAIDLPPHNVAAATGVQIVSRADWTGTRAHEQVAQIETLNAIAGMDLIGVIDVADLQSEAASDYTWWQEGTPPGFVTEVYRLPYQACALDDAAACEATDGGRALTGGEAFTLVTHPGEDLILVTRVHGRSSVPLTVSVDDRRLAQRVQPAVPGRWVEVVTWIPGDAITGTQTRIRIDVGAIDSAQDAYRPYYHWAYQGNFDGAATLSETVATFGAEDEVALVGVTLDRQTDAAQVSLTWQGPAAGAGDALLFVHLYNDVDAPPIAQAADSRPGGGALPPANWLPGSRRDTIRVPLPPDLPPGAYPVAIGLYDAVTGARYPVTGAGADDAGRLFIGEVTIEEPDS